MHDIEIQRFTKDIISRTAQVMSVQTAGGVKWWRTAQVMSVQMPGHYTRGRQLLLLSFEYMVFMAPPGV